jgi:hypothetical protein
MITGPWGLSLRCRSGSSAGVSKGEKRVRWYVEKHRGDDVEVGGRGSGDQQCLCQALADL